MYKSSCYIVWPDTQAWVALISSVSHLINFQVLNVVVGVGGRQPSVRRRRRNYVNKIYLSCFRSALNNSVFTDAPALIPFHNKYVTHLPHFWESSLIRTKHCKGLSNGCLFIIMKFIKVLPCYFWLQQFLCKSV